MLSIFFSQSLYDIRCDPFFFNATVVVYTGALKFCTYIPPFTVVHCSAFSFIILLVHSSALCFTVILFAKQVPRESQLREHVDLSLSLENLHTCMISEQIHMSRYCV